MTTPTWTAEDQSALDALRKKRNDYEDAIRKPIDDLVRKIDRFDRSSDDLASALVENADELVAALEPFLIPTTKEESVALEIGTATFDGENWAPSVSLHRLDLPVGYHKLYVFLKKDPS